MKTPEISKTPDESHACLVSRNCCMTVCSLSTVTMSAGWEGTILSELSLFHSLEAIKQVNASRWIILKHE